MSTSLLASLDALVATLARFAPEAHSPAACVVLVESLARAEKACAAARVRAASRAAEAGAHRCSGYLDATEWLARVSGTTAHQAERDLTTAHRLEALPATTAAVSNGELSLDQAEEIARTVGACPGAEPDMLVTARRQSLRALRDTGRDTRLHAIAPEELAAEQSRARGHRHWRDGLGMVRGSYALEPHLGMSMRSLLFAEPGSKEAALLNETRYAQPALLSLAHSSRTRASYSPNHPAR